MENDNDTLTKKILNGWKSLVSGSSQSQKKPFPENRFFSAEQLSFLDKQKKTTLLEKWATEIGRETAAKSGGKGEFNPVQWSDGLFGSWVDGNPYYVDETKQADYLRMLRDEGYELRPEHEKFILKQEKNSLLGKVLADKDSYLVIEDGNFGQKAESRFTLHSFNKETMDDVEVPFDLDMFHEEMRKGEMKFIGNEEKATFDDKFRQWKDAKALFNNTMRAIEGSQSYKNGGVFPPEMMFGQGNSSLGHYELSSWKSDNNFTIDVNVKLGNSKKTSTIIVSEENAFKYRDLLKDVSNFLAMEQDRPRVERIKSAENIGVAPQSNGEEKLLPKSRYFSIDELESLAKADNPTLLEKWAVELGKHCAEISNFFSSKEYRPVLWNDGKLSSWVDYESWELSDKHNEQNLKQLRAEGYKLDDAVTAEYQKNLGKLLSNKLFADFDDYIKVGNMDKDGTLEILRYDQKTMESTATKMGWQQFVNQVGKNSVRDISNDFLEKDFNNKMQKVNAAKQSFSETIERIKSLDANERSGIFSSEEKDHHYTNLGDYTGVSWEYKNNDTLVYKGFFGDDGDNIQEKVITKDSAYNHRGLLLDINDSIDNKMKASNRLKATSVQGLELYDREDLKNLVVDFFNETFEDTENAPTIKGVEVYGSRARGTANEKSDLDVVIEYEGDWKEDSVFNALHETPFEIEGIKVDINPINRTQSKSLGDFMKEAREYDQDILEKSNAKPRFSLKEDSTSENLDREYMEAIESGDMKKAQQMVNAAAASKGYASSSSYQGTSAFNGAAPWGNAYFDSPKERKEAWESDSEHLEYEGDQTLADYIENGIDAMSLDYIALDQRFYHAANEERKEAILNVRKTIQSKGDTITMYRSVPSSVKEDSFRNGDWVTPSKQYAIDNAAVHGWGDDYRIIEQEVPTNEVWWDGNDIAEWGYGREEDYVNDKDFAYKNTANNKKLLDAVTYDDDGKVIPLSKRFNESIKDIRYQDVSEKKALTMEEVELRETLIDKLRSSGISVVTDTNVGQNVLDRARFFRTEKGEAYGFTANGKIYIDPRIATAETPIHEYTHLWASAMQKGNPKEWQNIVGLMKDTAIWNEVKDRYQDLKGDDDIADEVLATYSGRKGAEKLRQMSQNASAEGNSAARKSSIARAIFQVQQALEKFWKGVSSFLGIHYGSTEEVADRVMKDMLGGINPSSQLKAFTESHNKEYMEAVKDGNMNKAYNLVMEQADMMLASNPMPEVTDAYEMRKTAPPKNTIKVYKVFTLDKDGDPSALFVSGKDKLPMGVWLNAQDTWHFTAENGKQYVPSTKNPSTQGGKTGASIKIPSEEVRQELIKRGYLPEGSKAKSITALAYRPGWHAADLPYFPQGGKQDPESNYGNVHRYNQVVFECELAADIDYTPLARNQTKAFNAKGKLNLRDADLQWMPKEGFYQYTTNQFLPDEEKGHWYIGGSIRINRALTQEECDRILTANGKAVQEWEQDILDLKRLGYVSSLSHVKPILSPVAYFEDGSIVPLSERFKTFKDETYQKEREAYENAKKTFYASDAYKDYMERENEARSKIRFMFAGEKGARNMDKADGQMLGNFSYRISMLNLAKTMLQDENYERLTKRMAKQDLKSIANFKQEKLIKHATGWELGVDGNWRYEIPDIKRFDWNGNINFEQNHPDYRRYSELVEKDNRHSWLDGEPLTAEERKELDKLSKTYEGLALQKLDNNQSLDAYIDAPELFKAYPELRDVKVKFGELAPNTLAKYSRSGNLMDYLLSIDDENIGVKSITFNTGKLNMLSNTDSIKSVICHEIQHAIQDIENFAKGGNLSELREHLQNELKFNQSQRDDIVSRMKVIARYEAAACNLEILSKASSGSGLDKERSSFLYWSAMDEIDKNQEGKINLKNDFEKVYGKGFDRQKPVDDGYHVTEAISELRRVASEYKSDISQGDQDMAKNLSLIELALERNSNDELYFKMAGEVESRNVEKRMNMTQKERSNSLASETEDVARTEQLVVTQSPVSMDLNLVPTEGRWHNKETQERDMYSHYGEILAGYLKAQRDNGCPWNIAREAIDSEGKKYEAINAYMMDLTNYDTHKYPIYLTEEQVRQEGYTINAKANPMPILQGDKVVEVYNVDSILDKDNHLLTSTNEVHTQYESWLRLNDSSLNSLDVFPTTNYEEFEDLSREKYKKSEDFREKLASALVGESRGKLPETPSAASKESFIRLLSTAMLGKKYGFSEVNTVSNPLQLAARLERDPEFVKDVLGEAAKTSCKVGTFVEETIRNWGEDKKLDLRSLNSVDIDEDDNGIVDSQEDLAPETLNESTELKKDEQKEQFHRSRFK